jgi:hypothetical protein
MAVSADVSVSARRKFGGSRSGCASSSGLGRETLETEILKDALAKSQSKKMLLSLFAEGRFPVKTVANTHGIVVRLRSQPGARRHASDAAQRT